MLKVNKDVVNDLIKVAVDKGAIPNINYKYVRNYFFANTFGVGMNGNGYDFMDKIYLPSQVDEHGLIVSEINHIYGIDLCSTLEDFGLNEFDTMLIFSVFHEVGHMSLAYEDIKKHGWKKRQVEWELDYDDAESGIEYRTKVREEKFADKFALRFIDDNLDDIIRVYKSSCEEYLETSM